jgi:hypothetical protein
LANDDVAPVEPIPLKSPLPFLLLLLLLDDDDDDDVVEVDVEGDDEADVGTRGGSC